MERLQVKTKNITRSTGFSDETNQMIDQLMYCTHKVSKLNVQEVEPIDEASSPDPPNFEEQEEIMLRNSNLRFELNKDCPICLTLMTEPCRFPKQRDPCDHMICKGCMEGMCEQANVITMCEIYKSICLTCPFCRASSVIDLNQDKDYIQVDKEHQRLLREVFEDEFRAYECCQDLDHEHTQEYNRCYNKYKDENCILNFEIGVREMVNQKAGVTQWQEYVKITNPEYNKIIDKIVSQVDFCINLTNYSGIKNPIVHKTNDQFFRNEKRKLIKEKKQVEIAMVPLGGRSYGTMMPDYLPVKLYFNQIKGLNANIREIVHENLKTSQNRTVKFRVHAQKKALDDLL